MRFNEEVINIVFFARGGQGAKTATEILAQTAVLEQRFVKAFPEFGPERSGAPIKTYLRISSKEIRTAEPIADPDIVIVLDETVLKAEKMIKSLEAGKDAIMITNTKNDAKHIASIVPNFKGKIYAFDASGLAMRIIGKPTPNIAIIGYIAKITELVKIKDVANVVSEIFLPKIGKEAVEKNIRAMTEAYDAL